MRFDKMKFIVFVLLIAFFVGFLMIMPHLNGKKVNSSIKMLEIKYKKHDNIKINNKLPLSDNLGKKIKYEDSLNENVGFLDFTVKNTSNREYKYNIILNQVTTDNNIINSNYIKLYLTDNDNIPFKVFSKNKVLTYEDLSFSTKNIENVILFSDSIEANKEKNYRLRVWISDSYGISKIDEFVFLKAGVEII